MRGLSRRAGALAILAIWLEAWLLGVLAGLLFLGIAQAFRVSTIAQGLRGAFPAARPDPSGRIPEPAVALIVRRVEKSFPSRPNADAVARMVAEIWSKMHMRPANPGSAVLLLLAYVFTLGIGSMGMIALVMPAGPQVVSDGVFELTLASGWVENPLLAESSGARLGASDPANDLHLAVFREDKAEPIDLTPRQYAAAMTEQMGVGFEDFVVGDFQEFRIGGSPAVQVEVDFVVDRQRLGMLLTFIETPTHYWLIHTSGLRLGVAANLDTLRSMTATFDVGNTP